MDNQAFARAWAEAGGSPQRVAKETGLTLRWVYRKRIECEKDGIILPTNPTGKGNAPYAPPAHFERRRAFAVPNGTILVFSDPHWLPDHSSAGTDAVVKACRKLKPELVVCGGDALDGTQISRFDPTRGHHKPYGLREQLECMKANFDRIHAAAGKAGLAWTLGNHDLRLSRYVAVQAEYLLDLPMTRLEDWAPAWVLSWAVELNAGTPGHTVIRHRNLQGMLHLQALRAATHMVHGHLHRLNVHRAPTFAGVRYSVDCGVLADPHSDAFDYAEGSPDAQQGFVVLTYRDGKLMPPELCEIIDGVPWFRGAPL